MEVVGRSWVSALEVARAMARRRRARRMADGADWRVGGRTRSVQPRFGGEPPPKWRDGHREKKKIAGSRLFLMAGHQKKKSLRSRVTDL